MSRQTLIGAVIGIFVLASGAADAQTPPPDPLLPIPTARQLDWQRTEMNLFVHFTVNTFTDMEWGDGTESPGIFNPTSLDVRQWTRVAKETGFRTVILTAKHHDGFCLWPSRYTDHSVASSSWRSGRGNVVGDLAEAVEAAGLQLGLYLSPWDRHEPTYGDTKLYNTYYMGQLRELLTRFGPLHEVWFDGAKGPDAKDMVYNFEAYRALVRQHQPEAVMFSDEGPDVRWIGNEDGFAGETNWSTMDRSKIETGAPGQNEYLNGGEMGAPHWVPGECDVSIRPGWFWHPDEQPKSVDELLDIYFKSVGRNCVLLLNIPPNDQGLFSPEDVDTLYAFRKALDDIFTIDLARHATASASQTRGNDQAFAAEHVLDGDESTYWAVNDDRLSASITLDLGEPKTFNVIRIQEPITFGQRIKAYRVEAFENGGWREISSGTTVGYKKLDRVEALTSSRVRISVDDAPACPMIAEVGLHFDPGR